MSTRSFRNWNNSATSSLSVVAVPSGEEELIQVVKDEATHPSPVRVGGKSRTED